MNKQRKRKQTQNKSPWKDYSTVESKTLQPVPFPRGMTLDKWRDNPAMVQEASEVFLSPFWGHIFSVLHNSAPRGYPLRGQPVDGISAAIELGRKEGYADAIAVLEALAISSKPEVKVESTFGVEE